METPYQEGHYQPTDTSSPVNIYPPKPDQSEYRSGNAFIRFLVSIIIYGTVYYFLFSRNWQMMIWFVGIVLFHELGHFTAMKILHYEDLGILFIPLVGAVAHGSKDEVSQKEKAFVLLAGPLPGIIAGCFLYYFAVQHFDYFQIRIAYIFIFLNMLNLLPIFPLDGGQLLKTLFMDRKEIIASAFFFFLLL